jgi:Domain of unknown function (DUF3854)
VPIVITEGELKTLSLWCLATHDSTEPRFLPVGLEGVWCWRGIIGKTIDSQGVRIDVRGVLPDFDRIQWRARSVTIVFDSDGLTNLSVQEAAGALARELRRRGALVRVKFVPARVVAA